MKSTMSTDQLKPELLTVNELFNEDAIYTVPVYQRNYAWQAVQIEQLIKDIHDAMSNERRQGYFLGNLVVTQRDAPESEINFEVVDGQQRLTTLYLLLTFLEKDGKSPTTHHQGRLRYESRARASEALRRAGQAASSSTGRLQDSTTSEDSGIHEGFNIIRQTMLEHEENEGDGKGKHNEFADFLRTKVTVVRVSLPPKTDLNRYFEIMNTRGQQLKQVDIVKARLMSKLTAPEERECFARIWDACADMDSYVQMSLTHRDTALRCQIFGDDWSWLEPTDFANLLKKFPKFNADKPTNANSTSSHDEGSDALSDALKKYASTPQQNANEDEGSEKFRSTIEFPVFLLHVLKVKNGDAAEKEEQLDDKSLIKAFDNAIQATKATEKWVQDFAFTLLKCRNLFDSFILKRQFVTRTEDKDGDWSLLRLKSRTSLGKQTPGYVHAFSRAAKEIEEDGEADDDTRDVLLLQSMLRITYTSPRSMHWITKVLQWLAAQQNLDRLSSSDLANLLRDYAREKVAKAFFQGEERAQGLSTGRIVFTYLDYLLLDEKAKKNFKFQFRNSIEHFYPQNPDKEQSGATVSDENLNLLGNLALVSVGANSKFSNNLPRAKAETFKLTIESQSPKLRLMGELTRNEGWGDVQVSRHHTKMVEVLRKDIKKSVPSVL